MGAVLRAAGNKGDCPPSLKGTVPFISGCANPPGYRSKLFIDLALHAGAVLAGKE